MYSPEELRRKRRAEVRKLKQAEVAAKKNGARRAGRRQWKWKEEGGQSAINILRSSGWSTPSEAAEKLRIPPA
jgi:hypothetical protein